MVVLVDILSTWVDCPWLENPEVCGLPVVDGDVGGSPPLAQSKT